MMGEGDPQRSRDGDHTGVSASLSQQNARHLFPPSAVEKAYSFSRARPEEFHLKLHEASSVPWTTPKSS